MEKINIVAILAVCVSAFVLGDPRCIFSDRFGIANCRGQEWTYIPYDCLQGKSIHTLDLGVNNITSLSDTSKFFELSTKGRIETILLDHNQISDLPHHLFDALPNIQFLDLSNNNLRHISRKLCHMTKLRELILDGNPIESISKNAFRCLRNLKYLSMANTSLKKLPVEFLKDSQLQELNLSGNQIENINEVKFPSGLNISMPELRQQNLDMFDVKSNEITIQRKNKNLSRVKRLGWPLDIDAELTGFCNISLCIIAQNTARAIKIQVKDTLGILKSCLTVNEGDSG